MLNQSRHDSETEQALDRPAALQQLLESTFPPAFPRDADSEKTIQWVAANIDKGMCRIYAIHINECLDEEGRKRLLERVRPRIDDSQLLEALNEILTAPAQPEQATPDSLAPLLADIALESIDQILQQARALGREGNFLHVQCLRAGNELIVLADQDARYEWILPAVKKRLREELANLHYEPAAIETQSFDLTCGEPLRLLDFELRLVKDRHGEARVRYRLVKQAKRHHDKEGQARLLGRYHALRFLRPCLNWGVARSTWQIVEVFYRKANSIQVGWRHLPITLSPIVALLFGWRSPATWLCLATIFVCSWRWWPLRIVRLVGAWTRRHKLDAAMAACALVALVCLYPLASEFYANLSGESAASLMPPGFHLGQYNKASPWDAELVSYGLYVPPHFRGEKGPFPLIVFLHGYGERTPATIFKAGLPAAIAKRFGSQKYGPFQFVAFFPIDPTGRWVTGSTEVEDIMTVLDDVIERHRIDPSRIYLTGISAGGSGVWELAQAYPNKWAALVPVSSFISPDVEKVRHIPAWIIHGAKDKQAPVERERTLVQRLKEAKADVRYTELPYAEHIIWQEGCDHMEFYDWLLSKKKN